MGAQNPKLPLRHDPQGSGANMLNPGCYRAAGAACATETLYCCSEEGRLDPILLF